MHRRHTTPRPHLALALVLGAALASCATEPAVPGTFSGRWAEMEWRGEASAFVEACGDSVGVLGWGGAPAGSPSDWQGVPTSVRIRIPNGRAGTYPVAAGAAEFEYLIGGDVVSARYLSDGGAGGVVLIEEQTAKWIAGRVVFDAVRTMESAPAGARARFEGRFVAPLRTGWCGRAGEG